MGYREFKAIPKDEWAVDKLFSKKTWQQLSSYV
jgi:hypothetical protein